MIYRFKSKASADLVMLGPQGDQVLSLLGRAPSPQGIIEAEALPGALLALQRAIDAEAAAAAAEDDGFGEGSKVTLRQRLWPVMGLLRQAQAAGEAVMWGA